MRTFERKNLYACAYNTYAHASTRALAGTSNLSTLTPFNWIGVEVTFVRVFHSVLVIHLYGLADARVARVCDDTCQNVAGVN